jgi:hypothetical protein
MAGRPTKNNADWFSHDNSMRNHRKVKAIRNKFGLQGYAFWCMFLELLTGADGNVFEDSEMEIEMISGDFGISVTEIRDMLNYCIKIELLFEKDGFINSDSLDERLKPVYIKRKTDKKPSESQLKKLGKYIKPCISVTEIQGKGLLTPISDTEITQSKVKEIKEKKEVVLDDFQLSCFNKFYSKYGKACNINECKYEWMKLSAQEVKDIDMTLEMYLNDTQEIKFRKSPVNYLIGKIWNDYIPLLNKKEKKPMVY